MDGCEPVCEKFTAKNIEGMRHKHFENSGFLSSPKTSSLVPKKKETSSLLYRVHGFNMKGIRKYFYGRNILNVSILYKIDR